MKLRHTEEREGFTIKLYTTPELDPPDWDIVDDEFKQLLDGINSGELEYFGARVTAEKNGIELASDYLGGFCCESIEEFIKQGDCYNQMVNIVINEARKNLSI